MGRRGIRSAYETGRGKIIVRAKTQIEEHRDGTSSIIVTELPYQVNKKMLVEAIAELAKDKRVEGLSDIDDHSSDRVGIRIDIALKRDANPQIVLNQLFKYTRLQDSFSVNMLAIHDGRPKTMGLNEPSSTWKRPKPECIFWKACGLHWPTLTKSFTSSVIRMMMLRNA